MSDKRIDLPTVLEDLQAIVAEKGDGYVYVLPAVGECRYVEENEAGEVVPSCIVGHVLARHGILLRHYAVTNAVVSVDDFLDDFTAEAIDALAVAQAVQDTCMATWGDALIAAKNAAAESVLA